jgi:hypothetical protein
MEPAQTYQLINKQEGGSKIQLTKRSMRLANNFLLPLQHFT